MTRQVFPLYADSTAITRGTMKVRGRRDSVIRSNQGSNGTLESLAVALAGRPYRALTLRLIHVSITDREPRRHPRFSLSPTFTSCATLITTPLFIVAAWHSAWRYSFLSYFSRFIMSLRLRRLFRNQLHGMFDCLLDLRALLLRLA